MNSLYSAYQASFSWLIVKRMYQEVHFFAHGNWLHYKKIFVPSEGCFFPGTQMLHALCTSMGDTSPGFVRKSGFLKIRNPGNSGFSKFWVSKIVLYWQWSNVYNSSSIGSFSTRFFAVSSLFSSLSIQHNCWLQIFIYDGLICSFHKLYKLIEKIRTWTPSAHSRYSAWNRIVTQALMDRFSFCFRFSTDQNRLCHVSKGHMNR